MGNHKPLTVTSPPPISNQTDYITTVIRPPWMCPKPHNPDANEHSIPQGNIYCGILEVFHYDFRHKLKIADSQKKSAPWHHAVDRVWHTSLLYNVHLKIKPLCPCGCEWSCLNLEWHYKDASHLLSAKVQRGRLEVDGSPGVPHVKWGTERKKGGGMNINNTSIEQKTHTLIV